MTKRSIQRQKVLDVIEQAPRPIGPQDIADATGMRAVNVRHLLGKLIAELAISRVIHGRYIVRRTPEMMTAKELRLMRWPRPDR